MSTGNNNGPARAVNGSAGVEADALRQKLLGLGLWHAAAALAEELSEAVKHDRAGHAVLDRLLSHEALARDERRVRTSLKLSNLPVAMTLGNFAFAVQPSIARWQVETLGTCAFIREHGTLLVQGPPGVGKTHLVVALGVRAIEQGFSVAFYRLEDLLHEMGKDATVSAQAPKRKK
jgi:DNA replication protein DnaC